MKVITSHERADMDALASIYAAALLYPEHQPVLPLKLNRNLRDFIALYKDELPFRERQELGRRRIEELILVDTQAIAPLRGMGPHTRIHIIDHHPLESPLPKGATFEGEPLGATTTLLVEKIRQRGLKLPKLGANLLLLGIYEDTGSLSYTATTARDVEAAAWLLRQGADLSLVGRFLHRPLSPAQQEALSRLIAQSTIQTIQGRSICLAAIELAEYVDELSSLIHQLMDIYEPEACFMLARCGGSVQIIARSSTEAIDVAEVLRELGGGGHAKAAAALVENRSLAEVRERLLQLL